MRPIQKIVYFTICFVCLAVPARADDQTLTWYGQAAFKLTSRGGKVLLIDPWLTNPKAPKEILLKHVEAILVTHGHFDHVGEAFELCKKYNAPLITSMELADIAQKHGVKNVRHIYPSGTVKVGEWTIMGVEAVHASSTKEGDQQVYAGAPMGFVIQEFGSLTIYHAGDTGVFQNMSLISELYHPNIDLLPIGGVYTMGPMEAARAAKLLQARVVVPMHFGTFPALAGTPEQLKKEMAAMGALGQVREMKIGTTYTLKDLAK